MDFNLLEIETSKTHKTMKLLIILIILVFISIICIFSTMVLKVNGIDVVAFFKNRNVVLASTDESNNINNSNNNEAVDETNEQEEHMQQLIEKLPKMNQEGVQKIKNIYKGGSSDNKIAYLTFDDGPSKSTTPQILDVLKENNVKATFFVLGQNAEIAPDIVKREYEEGHYVANHSYSHEYSSIYGKKENVLAEYNKAEKAIKKALENEEYSSGLFRFPGGSVGGTYSEVKSEAKELLKKNNVAYLDWNALTSDAVAGTDKKGMIKSLKETVEGNDIVVILMHDIKQDTADLLPEIIQYLRDEGYQFKNIYDIIQ